MKAERFEDALRKAVEASKRERTNFVALGEEETQAVADYIAASRNFFLNMPTGNNEGRAVEALSRLDALMEGRGDE